MVSGADIVQFYQTWWYLFDSIIAFVVFFSMCKYGALVVFRVQDQQYSVSTNGGHAYKAAMGMALGMSLALTSGWILFEAQSGRNLLQMWPFIPWFLALTAASIMFYHRKKDHPQDTASNVAWSVGAGIVVLLIGYVLFYWAGPYTGVAANDSNFSIWKPIGAAAITTLLGALLIWGVFELAKLLFKDGENPTGDPPAPGAPEAPSGPEAPSSPEAPTAPPRATPDPAAPGFMNAVTTQQGETKSALDAVNAALAELAEKVNKMEKTNDAIEPYIVQLKKFFEQEEKTVDQVIAEKVADFQRMKGAIDQSLAASKESKTASDTVAATLQGVQEELGKSDQKIKTMIDARLKELSATGTNLGQAGQTVSGAAQTTAAAASDLRARVERLENTQGLDRSDIEAMVRKEILEAQKDQKHIQRVNVDLGALAGRGVDTSAAQAVANGANSALNKVIADLTEALRKSKLIDEDTVQRIIEKVFRESRKTEQEAKTAEGSRAAQNGFAELRGVTDDLREVLQGFKDMLASQNELLRRMLGDAARTAAAGNPAGAVAQAETALAQAVHGAGEAAASAKKSMASANKVAQGRIKEIKRLLEQERAMKREIRDLKKSLSLAQSSVDQNSRRVKALMEQIALLSGVSRDKSRTIRRLGLELKQLREQLRHHPAEVGQPSQPPPAQPSPPQGFVGEMPGFGSLPTEPTPLPSPSDPSS